MEKEKYLKKLEKIFECDTIKFFRVICTDCCLHAEMVSVTSPVHDDNTKSSGKSKWIDKET